jgi:hypothetical protein
MAVTHGELPGRTWLFANHRRPSGQPDGEPFRPAAQPAGEDFGCARRDAATGRCHPKNPAPRLCALLAERPDAPAKTETRQAAAIRQVRAKICENYLRADRARYIDAKARDGPRNSDAPESRKCRRPWRKSARANNSVCRTSSR